MSDLSLLQDFIAETTEHLEEMEKGLLQLESHPGDTDVLNDIFRCAHTIKGAAEYVGLERTAELSHKLENLLELLRKGEAQPTEDMIDTLIGARDRIASLLTDLERSQKEETEIDDLIGRIEELAGSTKPTEDVPDSLEADQEPTASAFLDESEISDYLAFEDEDLPDIQLDCFNDDENPCEPVGDTAGNAAEPLEASVELEADDAGSESSASEAGEHYEEEYDEELFGIFLEQLEENLADIREIEKSLHLAADPSNLLTQCVDVLYPLRSSANYMGYKELTQIYDDWLEDVRQAQSQAAAGSPVDLDFMATRQEELRKRFPQLEAQDAISGPSPEDSEVQTRDSSPEENEAEIIEEEYDEELFEIFLNQLQEGLSEIGDIEAEPSDDADAGTLAVRYLEVIDRLHSSARYMGYEKLMAIYDEWKESVENVAGDAEENHNPAFDLQKEYQGRILKHFPGINNPDEDSLQSDAPPEGESAPDGEENHKHATQTGEMEQQNLSDMLSNALDAYHVDREFEDAGDAIESFEQLFSPTPVERDETDSFAAAGRITDGDSDPAASMSMSPGLGDTAEIPSDSETGAGETTIEGVEGALLESTSEEAPVHETVSPGPTEEQAMPRDSEKIHRTSGFKDRVTKQNIRVDATKIDALMNQVGELVVSRAWFSQLFSEMRAFQLHLKQYYQMDKKELKKARNLTFRLSEATVALGRVANDLQEGVMKIRMLPIAQLFNRYPRLVRDLVHNSDKQVRLEIKGEETELDKMIIEELSDPLIHIIRNAVDHGIETEDERRRAGKPVEGKITLEAYHESNHVVIEVKDDGRGIDPDRIRKAAARMNLLPGGNAEKMSDSDLMGLIMQPGFSTAEKVTHTSGRGVGMDVVKKNIEKLNGTVEIDSNGNQGTRFRIKIPLTLAIIPALLVQIGPELYTIPLAAVEETLRIFNHETTTIEGFEVIYLREQTLPLVRLADVFNIPSKREVSDKAFVVVVSSGLQRVGLVVDSLVGQEEVVIKPLVDYLQEKCGFSGATILGDGRISLILDVYKLIAMAMSRQASILTDFSAWDAPVQERGFPTPRSPEMDMLN